MFKLIKSKRVLINRSYSLRNTHVENKNYDHCINLVKNNDYENYLCKLLLPKDIIQSAFAIRAFNIEMASVATLSRDPKIGLMRFKFWKDRIDSIYKQPDLKLSGEPITSELLISIKKHNLSKNWFSRLIEARETQLLTNKTYQAVKDVEHHGEYTVSPIYYLLLECLKIKNVNCDHAASHLGKSHMIVNLVRSIPNQSRANISLVPLELLVKHKISQNEIIRLTNPEQRKIKIENENLKDLVYDLCNLSNQHLMKARKLNKQIPSNVNILFLNSIVIETFLKKIEKYNFDINNPVLHKRDSFLPVKLYLAKFKNIY